MTAPGGTDISGTVAALRAEMDAQKVNTARFWAQEWPALMALVRENQSQCADNSQVLGRIDEKLTALVAIKATLEKHDARLTALENVRWYAAGIALAISSAVAWVASKINFDHKG